MNTPPHLQRGDLEQRLSEHVDARLKEKDAFIVRSVASLKSECEETARLLQVVREEIDSRCGNGYPVPQSTNYQAGMSSFPGVRERTYASQGMQTSNDSDRDLQQRSGSTPIPASLHNALADSVSLTPHNLVRGSPLGSPLGPSSTKEKAFSETTSHASSGRRRFYVGKPPPVNVSWILNHDPEGDPCLPVSSTISQPPFPRPMTNLEKVRTAKKDGKALPYPRRQLRQRQVSKTQRPRHGRAAKLVSEETTRKQLRLQRRIVLDE